METVIEMQMKFGEIAISKIKEEIEIIIHAKK